MDKKGVEITTEATRVNLDNWSIQLPANFVYSTDHSVIDSKTGKERYLVAHYNDSTANFLTIYDSSFNFTVHTRGLYLDENATSDYTIPWLTRINTRTLMDGNEVLMATEHVMICYEEPTWIADSQAHHFRFRLFVDNALYLIQVFFGQCKPLNCKGKDQKKNFVLDLLKTIRYKGEENLDYDEINKVDDYNIEPLSNEDYKKESEAALKYLVAETLASKIPLCFSFSLTTDDNYDDDYDDDYDNNDDDYNDNDSFCFNTKENEISKINNDVSTIDDFKIEDGVLIDYKGTASCVDIPNSVIEIDCGALEYKEQAHITEITIPESVEIINDSAFYGTDCTEIFIPKNVKAVAASAFGGQSLLENITVDENNTFYSSEDGVLYNKDKSILICYPDGKKGKEFVVPSYVNNIDSNAFSFRDGYLERIIVSGNVKIIECDSFIYNRAIKIVVLNCGVKSIEKNAFKDCQNLEEIHLPESMERIIINAFTGCKNLKRIYVSDKLESEKVLGNIKKIAEKFGADIIIGNKTEKSADSNDPQIEIPVGNAPINEKSDSVEDLNSTIVNTETEVPLSKNLEPIIIPKNESNLKERPPKHKSMRYILLILFTIIFVIALIWLFNNQDFLYRLDFCNKFVLNTNSVFKISGYLIL